MNDSELTTSKEELITIPSTDEITLSEEQEYAYKTCVQSKERIYIVTGRPGTGKTTLSF